MGSHGAVLCAEITTGLDTQEGEGRDRPMQKAKMEIILTKSPQFDELMAGTTPQQAGQQAQRQQQTPGVGSGSGARGGPSQPSSSEDAAAGGAEPSEPGPSSQPQVCGRASSFLARRRARQAGGACTLLLERALWEPSGSASYMQFHAVASVEQGLFRLLADRAIACAAQGATQAAAQDMQRLSLE